MYPWDAENEMEIWRKKRMRFNPTLASAILALCVYANSQTLPLTDTTGPSNPISNIGSGTFEHAGPLSYRAEWVARNVSNKDIVALIESVSVQYPNDERGNALSEYESFFNPGLMSPGDTVTLQQHQDLHRVVPARDDMAGLGKPESQRVMPKFEVKTLWVQFADGTKFGDARYAQKLLADRKATFTAMEHLRDLYKNQSSASFLSELQNPTAPQEAGLYRMYVQQLRAYYSQTQDLGGTLRKLEEYLKTAESRGVR